MAKREPPSMRKKLLVSFALLLALFIAGSLLALLFGSDLSETLGNTALIRIEGPITGGEGDGWESVASSADIVSLLEEARDDDSIKAVLLEINSPGGSAVASDEIAQAVKGVRAEGKPVVAVIREVGASGAYWVASSTDHIVANRMSITGSIGVIGSYFEFADFLGEWNVTYRRLVSGDRKDVGDPFQELTAMDREFLQEKLDTVHTFFIEEVAQNRNMSVDDVRPLADGRFFLGVEAKEAGLVDELGGKDEARAYLAERLGEEVTTIEFTHEEGLLETLFGTLAKGVTPRITLSQPLLRT